MSIQLKPEQQVQRINALLNRLEDHRRLSREQLIARKNEKSWSVIEVMKHVSIAHSAYQSKVTDELTNPPTQNAPSEAVRCSGIPSYLIKRFPPQEGKIRLKMKTSKKFQPILNTKSIDEEAIQLVFSELEGSLRELKEWVNTYRTQPISMKKFNSAVGAVVRFNIPEACEFILCHNERHFHQIENNLKGNS